MRDDGGPRWRDRHLSSHGPSTHLTSSITLTLPQQDQTNWCMDGGALPHSDTQLVADEYKIKGAADRAHHPSTQRNDVASDACSICLEAITERAVAVPCNHLTFDFLCLVSWLQERASCPLCQAAVTEVQFDWRDAHDYKTYRVTELKPAKSKSPRLVPTHESARSRDRRLIERGTPRSGERSGEDPAIERRRSIYRNRLYALHVGANSTSQYRDLTPQTFANSPQLESRARAFLRRELHVFTFLDTASASRTGSKSFWVEYVVAILQTHELKGANGRAQDLLTDFLGRENATQLLHELEAWLRSPYLRLEAWDEHVQYADGGGVVKGAER